MISKNVRKSSEFLIIAPQYVKLKECKETAVHKSGVLSPKVPVTNGKLELKQKVRAIENLTKQSQKLLEKVKSLSPRSKQPQLELHRPQLRINKSKSRKQSSFEQWKHQLFHSCHEQERLKSNHQQPSHRPQDSSRNAPRKKQASNSSLHVVGTKEYERVLKRTKDLLTAYGTKLQETRSINRALANENITLKSKLSRYEKV